MAKVEFPCIDKPLGSFGNGEAFQDIHLVGVQIDQESPTTYDFSFTSLLNDNGAHSGNKYVENTNWNFEESTELLSKDGCPISCSVNQGASPDFKSLCALAENHCKNDTILSDLCVAEKFTLSDLICDECPPSVKKGLGSSDNLNLFDICLGADDDISTKKNISEAENGVSLGDLSNWMNSMHVSTDLSLNNDSEYNNETKSPISFTLNFKNNDFDIQLSDICNSISSNEESKYDSSDSDILSMLTESSIGNFGSSDVSNGKRESGDENCVQDFPADIDLSFCIKKNSKDLFSSCTSSSEAEDSGYSDTCCDVDQFPAQSKTNSLFQNILTPRKSSCLFGREKQVCQKKSLFFRVISAKPQTDDAKKSMLNKVRRQLLKESLSLNFSELEKNSQSSSKIINHSDDSVIISGNVMKFSEGS